MKDENDSRELSEEFIQEIKLHKIGFDKEISDKDNNYFNATIHCLTNIIPFSQSILENEDYDHPYSKLVIKLNQNNDNENINYIDINNCLIELKEYIFMNNMSIKDERDPRILINFLLNDLKNKEYLSSYFLTNFQKLCLSCNNILNVEELKLIGFDIPEIIKKINNKKITINDCFDYFFNNLLNSKNLYNCNECKKKKIKISSINKLPKILIILIDYGMDKDIYFDKSYHFDENINFKNCNCLKEDDKNREFFLSSVITCKNIGTYFELFYTFARADENSKYYTLYNGKDVREPFNINNKLKKEKMDFKNKRESWPFILVYMDKNINNEEKEDDK